MTGRWARVEMPDGAVRQDWVPAEQPPSPDGTTGAWHVVEDVPGQPTRWEWHADGRGPADAPRPGGAGEAGDAARPAPDAAPAAPTATAGPPDDRRAALIVGCFWGAFVALLPGVREPLIATWDTVSEDGSIGHAFLLALLVALYVLGAFAIARLFARPFSSAGATNLAGRRQPSDIS